MSNHVKEKLEHAIEEDARKHAALKQANVKEEEVCCPIFRSDLCTDLIVIVQDEFSDERRNVVPIKCADP